MIPMFSKHKDMSSDHKIILLLIKNGAKLKKSEFDDKDILEILRKYGVIIYVKKRVKSLDRE